ncbi:hypothetical protein [Paucisalibacillus globulus]|uniref:hypothetical protein n=1 Tax=Paucisalibacillus globulus TaxID=351095 RepID=UPI0003FB76F6|nr:hypothetical protein [Paucisalibacillus globulus]
MNLKLLKEEEIPHSGWGAGNGSVITEEYECPCGKGIVTYEKDDIPGFRSKSLYCNCEECRKKYTFSRGTATE